MKNGDRRGAWRDVRVKIEKRTIRENASLREMFEMLLIPLRFGEMREATFPGVETEEEFDVLVEKFRNKARKLGLAVEKDFVARTITLVKKQAGE